MAVVIGDLDFFAANGGDEVGEIGTPDSAEDGIAEFDVVYRADWGVSAFLARFDARGHGVAAFAEGDGFSGFEAGDPGVATSKHRSLGGCVPFLHSLSLWKVGILVGVGGGAKDAMC